VGFGGFAAMLLLVAPAMAQSAPPARDGFDIHGSMRLRYETIDGQVRPALTPVTNLSICARS
jgi:hypothetical protein